MQLVTMPYDYAQSLAFIKNNIDCILLGHHDISLRCAKYFSWQQIEKICKAKQKTKVFILVNQFFFEQDLDKLLNYLVKLNELKVDGIYFQDYAVAQLVQENKLKLNLIYHPETLVTSYGQFDFFQKNKINHVVLARELFKTEVKNICEHKPKQMQLEIQAQGLMFIMHSRWKMISNFQKYADLKINSRDKFWIRETLRKYPNAIYEDEYGTHMFSGYELCVIEILNELKQMGIDFIRIDNIMQNKKWCEIMTYTYDKAIKLANQNKLTKKAIETSLKTIQIAAKPHDVSLGFLGTVKDNYHLVKVEDEKNR